jgi:hypothetical protein
MNFQDNFINLMLSRSSPISNGNNGYDIYEFSIYPSTICHLTAKWISDEFYDGKYKYSNYFVKDIKFIEQD